ncbi:MAG: OmpA family protein, partial [Desulfobulbaceae bacterium]|nr:OmpA family protein [Desulfobulbaceae bacterium]
MKKIIFISALALTLSSASMAMASLSSDIRSMGMCKAVANAVSRGTTVSMIIGQSRGMSQADQKTLFTALYSAGANDDTIRISAEKAKISDLILMEAFNASNNQGCVDNRTPPAPAAATPVVAATTPPVAQEASASQTASQTAPSAASAPVAVTPVATTPVATTPVAVTPVAATPPASGKTLPHLKAILPLKANSQSLTSEGKAALAHFVRKFKNIGQGKIEVRGYVSSSTSSKGNTQRSIERAEAVQAMLISAGVDRASIVTRGMGIENPVASNKTSTGR